MTTATPTLDTSAPPAADPRSLRLVMLLLAAACGAAVANIYYAQPLLPTIASVFRLDHGTATLVVAVTQAGYALGLAFLLPLGDLVESRTLATRTLLFTALACALACVSPDVGVLIAASVLIGATSVVAQILMPVAAHLAPDHARGRYVGMVTSGLLLGIMLARSVSSFAAAAFGWRSIFGISAVLMIVTSVVLRRRLPRIARPHRQTYRALLASTVSFAVREPVLRRRAIAQALMFGTFSTFWTAVVYELTGHHHLSQAAVGVFALVGAAGAAVAPLAGRIGDAGHGSVGRVSAFVLAVASMLLAWLAAGSVVGLAVAAVLLDVAAQLNHVLSMRDIYGLRPDARARINSVYMTTMFLGGAASSAVAGVVNAAWGWTGVCVMAVALSSAGVLFWLTGPRIRR